MSYQRVCWERHQYEWVTRRVRRRAHAVQYGPQTCLFDEPDQFTDTCPVAFVLRRVEEQFGELLDDPKIIQLALKLPIRLTPRKRAFKPRLYNEKGGNSERFTRVDHWKIRVGLLEATLDELRRAQPGSELHSEIWAWIDAHWGAPTRAEILGWHKSKRADYQFSFELCCELTGVSPTEMRVQLEKYRELGYRDYRSAHENEFGEDTVQRDDVDAPSENAPQVTPAPAFEPPLRIAA